MGANVADYDGIRLASVALRDMLQDHITNNPDAGLKNVPIELLSPREMRDKNLKLGVSLWLYQVDRFDDLLNLPPVQAVPGARPRAPVPVSLHYLVTPITGAPEDAHALLGRVLQTFNDHAMLRGADLDPRLTGPGDDYGLRLTLRTPTLEEHTRIWSALNEPYRLSINYLVQLVHIGSAHPPVSTSPVREVRRETVQIVEAP